MNDSIRLLRRMTVDEVARWLELHPFEVVRILACAGQLPEDLRLEAEDVENVRRLGGLETWWDEAPAPERGESPARALLRALVQKLLAQDLVEPRATRADNLFRGLAPEAQVALRKAVNLLIRERYLVSRMMPSGLAISVRTGAVEDLRAYASHGTGPLAMAAERV
ncbi:MAG: hypothetical protein ACOZNI_06915 [Myxococcota bacterium]